MQSEFELIHEGFDLPTIRRPCQSTRLLSSKVVSLLKRFSGSAFFERLQAQGAQVGAIPSAVITESMLWAGLRARLPR
jgi:hypothetical protein